MEKRFVMKIVISRQELGTLRDALNIAIKFWQAFGFDPEKKIAEAEAVLAKLPEFLYDHEETRAILKDTPALNSLLDCSFYDMEVVTAMLEKKYPMYAFVITPDRSGKTWTVEIPHTDSETVGVDTINYEHLWNNVNVFSEGTNPETLAAIRRYLCFTNIESFL